MGIFKKSKKSVVEVQEDQIILEMGLKVLQTDEGFFGVYQMQTGEKILVAETKEKAEKAKSRLENLTDWDTPNDVLFMILSGDTDYEIFEEMNKIIDYYDMETEEGNTFEWFTYK